jgi:hypothetical protein
MRYATLFAGACCSLLAMVAIAQEHWTEGPVWECSTYRTKPGQFDTYMKYLRENFVPTTDEAKKQGLVVDSKVFIQPPNGRNDWDVMICSLYPSFGKALDFNASDDEKAKAIEAKHYKTADEEKQAAMSAKRLDMREYIGTSFVREVNLKPLK